MKRKSKIPIRIALYGMDERAAKMISMYLQGPCKGVAEVVDEADAEMDIIDADFVRAKDELEQRQSKTPERPIILFSLEELNVEGTFFVKKPVQASELVAAIYQAYASITEGKTKIINAEKSEVKKQIESAPALDQQNPAPEIVIKKKQAGEKHTDSEEIKKTSKHRTAMDLTEGNFSAYLGHIEGIDFSDIKQVRSASFNPKDFFLGYVQSAYRVARNKGRVLQLNSSWKPLVIFPHSHEIWLDANDKQLRAFAGLSINNKSGAGMSLSSSGLETSGFNNKMESFYDLDTFVWKLAIWTSKGRYPDCIDIDRPVYLSCWPNFTRLIITPHALRIAALLIVEPVTLLNIADSLNIKPQYVFVFISAAIALGIAGQAERQADQITAPEEIKKVKAKGLLSKILGKLRSKGDIN
jgi:hypothetical protein